MQPGSLAGIHYGMTILQSVAWFFLTAVFFCASFFSEEACALVYLIAGIMKMYLFNLGLAQTVMITELLKERRQRTLGPVSCQAWPLPAQQLALAHLQFSQNKKPVGDRKKKQEKKKQEDLNENMIKLTYLRRYATVVQTFE